MSERDPSDSFRRRLEGIIPELVKRAVELGVEKASEAPEAVKQMVGDLKLPKEIAGYVFSQVEETKNGIFGIVAKEIRGFLEHANLSGEMQKLLTTVQFEVNTTIRFRPNDGKDKGEPGDPPPSGMPKPEVMTDVSVRRGDKKAKKDD